ncbi:MAG: hypothetical protein AAGA68_23740 [Pseudomonadota bacterium]
MSVRRAASPEGGSKKAPENPKPRSSQDQRLALPNAAGLQRLVAGLGQWLGVGKQVIALHDRTRCVALVVPISPHDRILVPQVALSVAQESRPAAPRGEKEGVAAPAISPELMAITSLRLAQYAPPREELQRVSADGYAMFRSYAWWLALHATAAKVTSADPRELVRLTRWPALGTEVDRSRAMRLCTVLSRGPFCPRDLAILSRQSPLDTDAFVTAGAILRFVELTGETVQGRTDRGADEGERRHPLSGVFSSIRQRFRFGRD